jgi:hypothetical protein
MKVFQYWAPQQATILNPVSYRVFADDGLLELPIPPERRSVDPPPSFGRRKHSMAAPVGDRPRQLKSGPKEWL